MTSFFGQVSRSSFISVLCKSQNIILLRQIVVYYVSENITYNMSNCEKNEDILQIKSAYAMNTCNN